MRNFWLPVFTIIALLAGCRRPAEKPAAEFTFSTEPPVVQPVAGIVPIPEEFQTPQEAPSAIKAPATPPILFVARDFQITNRAGIQGIQAGETVNLLRETPDEYIVQYGDLEFIKEKEYFSSTYVGKTAPDSSRPTPASDAMMPSDAGLVASANSPSGDVAPEEPAEVIGLASEGSAGPQPSLPAEPVDSTGLTAPVGEPPLPDESLLPDVPPPPPTAAEKELANLTDAIRTLNNQIRAAEDASATSGKKPTRAERRRLEQMKDERDDLSRQLTKIGKP